MICLGVPVLMYTASALSANLNLGLRHMLPIYPFVYIAIGMVLSHAWTAWGKPISIIGAALAVGLAAESFSAFPNYIAYFNVAVGGSRGGLKLLTDSNLDWGQDLKLLGQWRERHPVPSLYLCYFGMADPRYYGIDYHNLPESFAPGDWVKEIEPGSVLAISARHLQGVSVDPNQNAYVRFQRYRPIAVLGGSIYLYDWPPR
jgi:hypothetical protein